MSGCGGIAVIVPTFNRRASLRRLLESMDRQTLPRDQFEVVVVDNNSTDGTADEVTHRARSGRLRLRCVTEPSQGATHARNRGIRETQASVLAFTDDDIEVDPAWLAEILAGFAAYGAAAVGGRTEAIWDAPLPGWWLPEYDKAFVRNWGDQPRPVTEFPFFYSLNLAIQREALEAVGVFDTRLGPKATQHVVGEDADLCRRIHQSGRSLHYLPGALVYHHVGRDRLCREFLRRRFYYRGATHALQRRIEGRALEVVYQLKVLAVGAARWGRARSVTDRFRRELDLWYRVGFLTRAGWVRGLRASEAPGSVHGRKARVNR